jgi:hypothetical protein
MANINLPIDNTLIADIDAARGKQPRVSWIRDAISEKLSPRTIIVDAGPAVSTSCAHPNVHSSWTRICPDCKERLRP